MAVTRNQFRVRFDDQRDAGKTVRYRGRWLTASGKMGPWGPDRSLAVPLLRVNGPKRPDAAAQGAAPGA